MRVLAIVRSQSCKVLDGEVPEFFKNATVNREGSKLKKQSLKHVSQGFSQVLEQVAPTTSGDTEFLSDQDYGRSMAFCGLSKKSSSVRRKFMNEEGKLLSDIIGQVLLCKPGSIDYIANDMFKLMVAVICRSTEK